MCNFIHSDGKPIRKIGKGWKLFKQRSDGVLTPIFHPYGQYVGSKKFQWNDSYNGLFNYQPVGFTFFLNRKEAMKVKNNWNNSFLVIKRIAYWNGIEKHIEKKIVCRYKKNQFLDCPVQIALCKGFKIID